MICILLCLIIQDLCEAWCQALELMPLEDHMYPLPLPLLSLLDIFF